MKIIRHKIIIPIKLHFLKKRIKELDAKFSTIENVVDILCNTTFQRGEDTKAYKEKCLKIMNMSQAITTNRIKTYTKIIELQRELKNG